METEPVKAELRRKQVVDEYFRRLNAGDVPGVLALFADDARIEDPVGHPAHEGDTARETYVSEQVGRRARLTPGTLVASHDEEQVAVPYTVSTTAEVIDALGLFRVGPAGTITEIRAFSGRTDRRPTDAPQHRKDRDD
ncbi:nuclear transport factor 2 family protein [Streptomyces phaeochromogenes]|uniref:nuclear transport factor 2 family protein n=1 Tax=Streptomyces phaeochromogenes TaxID=1923 RepID=UPI003678064A